MDNIQSLSPELLQPLSEAVSSGYNGALLICGAFTGGGCSVIDNIIIKQVLENLFSHLLSNAEENLFISVSFLQFYPDGSAVDVLNPDKQTLKPVAHPILGKLIAGLCEVCVSSAQEAFTLYETCMVNLKSNTGPIFSRCSSLFSVTVELKLDPEESEICRNKLQLFSLAGGASRTDLRGVSPLVKVLDQTQCEATRDKPLPFLLNEALTGNSRTALVYCLHPQGKCSQEGTLLKVPLKP
ncbi:kinesin-like protein KIF17 [Halichoeres trimaculatus]|uniref:kinesin-like protein KIF17 n=1 Tax=Halichoeres trimaculatus TaxID=147232 RepID=UPI003D9DF6F1